MGISVGSHDTIGGTQVGSGNLISGNGMTGVNIGSFSNQVQGNLIGTDVTGTAALGLAGFIVAFGRREAQTPLAVWD